MGMDVYGKNPTAEVGQYFRNSVWGWHPLADYLTAAHPALTAGCTYWHSNDGDGLDEAGALALADALDLDLANGTVALYEAERSVYLAALPMEECWLCSGTGVRTDEIGVQNGLDKPRDPVTGRGGCNACSGTGQTEPSARHYPFEVANVAEFARFARHSGASRSGEPGPGSGADRRPAPRGLPMSDPCPIFVVVKSANHRPEEDPMTTTAQPTIVQATSAADFLGLIPALIGYTPTRSIVVVPFRGNHTAGAARFDLNEDTDPHALASTITGIVCRIPDARAVAVVIYTDQDGHTTRPIISALLDRATECGFGIKDALYVARDGWGSALTDDQPHPLAEINSALAAGRATAGDQHSGTEIPAPDEDRLEAVLAAFEDFGLADVAETDWVALAEVAATTPPEEIDPFDAASLIFALSRPSLRDIAIVQWATDEHGGERAAEAQAGWEHGEEYPTDLASIMWGDAPRPDARRLQAALTTVRHLTALAPQPLRAGLLATIAWLSWALGHSTHADAYARQALAIEPGHGLSEIVASFVQAGHLPRWAFER